MVTSPAGPRRLVMCCDCNYGPFGHQLEGEPRLWLACDLLHQQDASLGSNEADFPLPEGLDMRALQSMIDSVCLTLTLTLTLILALALTLTLTLALTLTRAWRRCSTT